MTTASGKCVPQIWSVLMHHPRPLSLTPFLYSFIPPPSFASGHRSTLYALQSKKIEAFSLHHSPLLPQTFKPPPVKTANIWILPSQIPHCMYAHAWVLRRSQYKTLTNYESQRISKWLYKMRSRRRSWSNTRREPTPKRLYVYRPYSFLPFTTPFFHLLAQS